MYTHKKKKKEEGVGMRVGTDKKTKQTKSQTRSTIPAEAEKLLLARRQFSQDFQEAATRFCCSMGHSRAMWPISLQL